MQPNVKSIGTLLMLNLALVINSANPVSFTYDNNVIKKTQGIVGDILLDLVNDSLLDSLLNRTARFTIYLNIDKNGKILSVTNRSKGISDNIISEFIKLLKKNNTELYVYIETPSPRPKNKYDYINLIKGFKFPQTVHLYFLEHLSYYSPLFDNYLNEKKLKLNQSIPSRAKIKKILNKHKNIYLKTSRDFGVTEKDYYNTNDFIFPTYSL